MIKKLKKNQNSITHTQRYLIKFISLFFRIVVLNPSRPYIQYTSLKPALLSSINLASFHIFFQASYSSTLPLLSSINFKNKF